MSVSSEDSEDSMPDYCQLSIQLENAGIYIEYGSDDREDFFRALEARENVILSGRDCCGHLAVDFVKKTLTVGDLDFSYTTCTCNVEEIADAILSKLSECDIQV